jgi:hypothetical protein
MVARRGAIAAACARRRRRAARLRERDRRRRPTVRYRYHSNCRPHAASEQLVKLGRRVGPTIKELITIVSPVLSRAQRGNDEVHAPETWPSPEARECPTLIVRMAKDTGRGYRRILGELRKLGLHTVSRATIGRVLHEHGLGPGPKRRDGTWHDFVQRHFESRCVAAACVI